MCATDLTRGKVKNVILLKVQAEDGTGYIRDDDGEIRAATFNVALKQAEYYNGNNCSSRQEMWWG